VGVDDTPNTIGEYVQRPQKAWTAANANPVAIQAELCAFAAWSTSVWNTHPTMLANLSAWIAEEAAYFNIPIVKLTPQQAQTDGRGVCQHRDLGSWGGSHSDCGDGFPIDNVLAAARTPTPAPTPPSPPSPFPDEEDPDMILIQNGPQGGTCIFDGQKKTLVTESDSLRAFQNAGLKTAVVSQTQFDKIPWA
jgi:hypothetical protein